MWKISRVVPLQQLRLGVRLTSRRAATDAITHNSVIGSIAKCATNSSLQEWHAWREFSTTATGPRGKSIEWHNKQNNALVDVKERFHSIKKSDSMTDQVKQELVDIFAITKEFQLNRTMIAVFDWMMEKYPDAIDAAMYEAVYLPLLWCRKGSREKRKGQYLIDIYQTARPHFEPLIPEIIYRYGIIGSAQITDTATADALVHEMVHVAGIPASNMVYSWLIGTHGHLFNTDKVMEYYAALNESEDKEWDAFAVLRVVKGLAQVDQLVKAFEFCKQTGLPLNGPILCAIISRCFALRNKELASQLMTYYRECGVARLDGPTQQNLSKWLLLLDLKEEVERLSANHAPNPPASYDVEMDLSIDMGDIDLEKQHHKVDYLLSNWEKGQGTIDLDVLIKIFNCHIATWTNPDIRRDFAYRAAKLLHKQNEHQAVPPINVAKLFNEFKDPDASVVLCESVLEKFKEDLQVHKRTTLYKVSQARMVLDLTTKTLVEDNSLPQALSLLQTATECGLCLTKFTFWRLLSSMRAFGKFVVNHTGHIVVNQSRLTKPFLYLSDDFEQVLDLMDKHHIRASTHQIALVCCALGGGTDAQRQRLLKLWRECVEYDKDDPNKVAPWVYTALLQTASRAEDFEEASRIYMIAMSTVNASSAHANTAEVWELLHVAVLAKSGNMASAIHRLQTVAKRTTTALSKLKVSLTTVKLLCSAINDQQQHASIETIMQLLEQHEIAVNSRNASYIVRIAKEQGLPHVARSILQLYERVEASDKTKREKKQESEYNIKYREAQVLAMYNNALELCGGEDEAWDVSIRHKIDALTSVKTENVEQVVS